MAPKLDTVTNPANPPYDDVPFNDVPWDDEPPFDPYYDAPPPPDRAASTTTDLPRRAALGPHATAGETLEKVFGYSQFRGQQADIIQTVIDGGDALVLMPTGGGKSLC